MMDFMRVVGVFLCVIILAVKVNAAELANPEPIDLEVSDELCERVTNTIEFASHRKGWSYAELGECNYEASYRHEHYSLKVAIQVINSKLIFEYLGSENLNYKLKDGVPHIHRSYIAWVNEFSNEIKRINSIGLLDKSHTDMGHEIKSYLDNQLYIDDGKVDLVVEILPMHDVSGKKIGIFQDELDVMLPEVAKRLTESLSMYTEIDRVYVGSGSLIREEGYDQYAMVKVGRRKKEAYSPIMMQGDLEEFRAFGYVDLFEGINSKLSEKKTGDKDFPVGISEAYTRSTAKYVIYLQVLDYEVPFIKTFGVGLATSLVTYGASAGTAIMSSAPQGGVEIRFSVVDLDEKSIIYYYNVTGRSGNSQVLSSRLMYNFLSRVYVKDHSKVTAPIPSNSDSLDNIFDLKLALDHGVINLREFKKRRKELKSELKNKRQRLIAQKVNKKISEYAFRAQKAVEEERVAGPRWRYRKVN